MLVGFFALYAAVDVAALLVQGREDAAGVGVEFEFGAVVTDFADYVAGGCVEVDVSVALYFAGDNHLAGSDECFAGHLRVGVAGEELVEHSIADLVGHLIGMAFRH